MNILKLLIEIDQKAANTREKGAGFENICKLFLENDKTYAPQFSQVQTYAQWADKRGLDKTDIGIDLVATNTADPSSYAAVQCKFYDPDSSLDKKGIDSFLAASMGKQFDRRIFFDTTKRGITKNVLNQIQRSIDVNITRIGLEMLEGSSIDWDHYSVKNKIKQKPKHVIRPHQREALEAVKMGFADADRGKLIMACGTGKTFTALKIAEELAGTNKSVLFLAPSLALVSQTITEWTVESDLDIHAFAVCSDTQVGKRKIGQDDIAEINTHDLAYPATTDPRILASEYNKNHRGKMRVIFATYQSIDVIGRAQNKFGLAAADLVICDEAHRTTGASLAGQDESHFVRVHDPDFIKASKRLYMTATPRVYITQVKQKADEQGAKLYSMDDENKFGREFYTLKFGEAVEQNLLSDYKVLVLAVDEDRIARDIQKVIASSDNSLTIDDGAKMVGCYKALLKIGIEQTEGSQPMRRAVSFCRSIKDSQLFRDEFNNVVNDGYLERQDEYSPDQLLTCEIKHLDGTMNTAVRNAGIGWLKEEHDDRVCRILTNARCLSEGVDVPTLDAVLFVHSRKSKVDIVQSVGRVMRKSAGKQWGYVILPIAIESGVDPAEALKNNKKYAVVWDVLNALRSHDERLDSEINRIEFGGGSDRIEVVSEIKDLPGKGSAKPSSGVGEAEYPERPIDLPTQQTFEYQYDSVHRAIRAIIVKKCGQREYWENWAGDVAEIAHKHILRINSALADRNTPEYRAFKGFLHELRKNINAGISQEEVVEMLAQHIITKPVFEALFADYDFGAHNPVSQAIQKVLEVLDRQKIDNEAETLDKFYASVKRRVAGVDSDLAKQKIIIELYDRFFRGAFPKLTERLGIVYTPAECVDFIIHSVNDILKKEFNQTLADENTHIIDPFTGTGTFITRLLQSGLIPPDKLGYKFNNELHANEIVLLAYYIASVNIESTYHALVNSNKQESEKMAYEPFNGICLTDTFQLYESAEDLLTPQLPVNSKRLNKQKNLDIKVIIGNPPYSAGQQSGNDNNQNLAYPKLDARIEHRYAKYSTSANKNSLYDSYIRAICWASDRIGDAGVIGFITNAGWIDSSAADGLRKSLIEEFSSLYVFNLKGNARTQGEQRRKEAGNIFEGGSRAPIAISILVKNPGAATRGDIYYYDIGDYLGREQKLKIVEKLKSIDGIRRQKVWRRIEPDKFHDWLDRRDERFYEHIPIGDKKGKAGIFENYSRGLGTRRDAWVYNASKLKLEENIKKTIDFYNRELERYNTSEAKQNQPNNKIEADKYIARYLNNDSAKIAFSRDYRYDIFNGTIKIYNSSTLTALYRPFNQIHAYYDRTIIMELLQMPKIYPERGLDNLVIGVSGRGANSFSCLISDYLIDLHLLESGTQCFPLKLYQPVDKNNDKLFNSEYDTVGASSGKRYRVKDGITDAGLKYFTDFYRDNSIGKEDLFYYLYGLLHSEDYRHRYAHNLTKDLPRIPRVKRLDDFKAFSEAGKDLADLHLHYEDKEPYPVRFEPSKPVPDKMNGKDFYVQKMKFPAKSDKTTIIYNDNITLTGIPREAYEYVVNGKSAIEWVMDRQKVSTHKASGITNDPNDWANETMNNPRYPLDLLLKVVTVSLDSVKIINSLPKLNF